MSQQERKNCICVNKKKKMNGMSLKDFMHK